MALHMGAALLFLSGRRRWALLVLLCAGAILRYYFAALDPFLHDWDERFHALVAKNLTQHWLKPTLFDQPVMAYHPENWFEAHVWLHKQPLFLWQMAVSIKLLGATEFAVRLPSLVMTSTLILVIYSIGRAVFGSVAGFITAFIFSCYGPILEMNSGMMGMEHNDIAFLFYVTLSIWAWVYYEQRKQTRHLLLMGFFAGCAVLCKWLTGLLVFSGFTFYHLLLARDLFRRHTLLDLAKALGVTLATFLPWQLFILWHYPVEAHFEYAYNSRHFSEVLEGHRHEVMFYFNVLPDYFRGLQYVILPAALFIVIRARTRKLASSLVFMFTLVYLFFTVAQTKLQSYVMVVMPIGLLLAADTLAWLVQLIWRQKVLRYIGGLTVFAWLLVRFINWPLVVENHFDPATWQGNTRTYKMQRATIFKSISGKIPSRSVLLSLEQLDNIDAMFYTGKPAYGFCSAEDYHFLKDHNYNVVFWGDSLPAYARADSTAHLVKDYLPHQ